MVIILRCFVILLLVSVAACGDNDRYEISKDSHGRTVRLDKKTGQIAVIDGDEIKVLKDPKQLESEKQAEQALAKPKYWLPVDNANLNVTFSLKTSWIDGQMFYKLTLSDLRQSNAQWAAYMAKSPAEISKANAKLASFTPALVNAQLARAASHAPFVVQLFDENMTKLKDIQVMLLARDVDDKGFAQALEYQSSIPMSADLYQHLKTFNVQWYGR